MLDWLIVGGGIHGTHLAHMLTARGRVAPDRLRVLDPHPEPLAAWDACTRNTGMPFLRSPVAHHLDIQPAALHHFAETEVPDARFIRPYHRPSTTLFRRHAEAVIDRHGLRALRVCGRAQGLDCGDTRISVETDAGRIVARRAILALGAGETPLWPDWAHRLRRQGGSVDHIFDPGFCLEPDIKAPHTIVVGGGISAAQVAITLARAAPGRVTLVSRHAPRIAQFDSDICWIGERCLRHFRSTRDPNFRRAILHRARHRGSMPPDVLKQLRNCERRGSLRIVHADVCDAIRDPLGTGILLQLHQAHEPLTATRIILATGFAVARPGGAWLGQAVLHHNLPTAACGYPIVDTWLRWHPRLHVSGPLAELEIGPVARNIIGARLAGLRLAPFAATATRD